MFLEYEIAKHEYPLMPAKVFNVDIIKLFKFELQIGIKTY